MRHIFQFVLFPCSFLLHNKWIIFSEYLITEKLSLFLLTTYLSVFLELIEEIKKCEEVCSMFFK